MLEENTSGVSHVVTHPCVGMVISAKSGGYADNARSKALKLFSWWQEDHPREGWERVSLVTESIFSPTLGYCSFAILTGGLPEPEANSQEFTKRYKQAEADFIAYMEELNRELSTWKALTWYRILPEPECTWFDEI